MAWTTSLANGWAEEPGPAARLAGREAAECCGDLGFLGVEALRIAVVGHVALDARRKVSKGRIDGFGVVGHDAGLQWAYSIQPLPSPGSISSGGTRQPGVLGAGPHLGVSQALISRAKAMRFGQPMSATSAAA